MPPVASTSTHSQHVCSHTSMYEVKKSTFDRFEANNGSYQLPGAGNGQTYTGLCAIAMGVPHPMSPGGAVINAQSACLAPHSVSGPTLAFMMEEIDIYIHVAS